MGEHLEGRHGASSSKGRPMGHVSEDRFEQLILPHLDDAYTLARYLLRDAHDAQDAVQEAALRAFRYFDSYRGGDARAWFLAIVRNCCHTWKRQQGDLRTIALVDTHVELPHESYATDDAAIGASERENIERIMAELPNEFREVLVLRELQELSYVQIGEVLGVPIGTVMSRLSRARKRVAARLGGHAKEAS